MVLLLSIIILYLKKIGRKDLLKYSYSGLIIAIIASVITAIIFNSMKAEFSKTVEAVMFFITALLVLSLIIWFHYGSKHLTKGLGKKIEKSLSGWQRFGIFLLTFLIIFREGAEIILLLVTFENSQKYGAYIEAAIGIIIVIVLAYIIMKGKFNINLKKFFKITSIMLSLVFIELIMHGFLELMEEKIIIVSPIIFETTTFFIDGFGRFIFSGALLLLVIILIWDIIEHRHK